MQLGLVDTLDLGLAPGNLLVVDNDGYTDRLDDIRRSGHEARPVLPEPTPDQLFLLIFTSGSTVGPKAVRMTQGRAARASARVGFSSDDVLYSAMPLFHGNAISAAVLPALASGATLACEGNSPPSTSYRTSASAVQPSSTALGGPSPISWPPHRLRTIGITVSGTYSAPRRRPRTRQPSPSGSAFSSSSAMDRARMRSCSSPCRTPDPGPWAGPAGDDIAVVDPDTWKNYRRLSSTSTGGSSTLKPASANS